MWQTGYILKVISGVCHTVPRFSNSSVPHVKPQWVLNSPNSPSNTSFAPVNPAMASWRAYTALWAAQPGCSFFTQLPSLRNSCRPAAWLPQIPSALTRMSRDTLYNFPATQAAAKDDTIPVP